MARPMLDASHLYTLPELVDIAEGNNPETRAIWEQAKQRAAAAGIARSALFPTVAALASASYNQYSLFVTRFYHEDLATFPATLSVNYTVFDFGARDARIDQARASLLAADFTFNDAHRKVIFEVAEAYYRLLDAISQEEAAQATLTDAQTVQQAIEARLANGLATLPDVLEARAATAQAKYELASVRGLEDIAHGSAGECPGCSSVGSVPSRGRFHGPRARGRRRARANNHHASAQPEAGSASRSCPAQLHGCGDPRGPVGILPDAQFFR